MNDETIALGVATPPAAPTPYPTIDARARIIYRIVLATLPQPQRDALKPITQLLESMQ